MGRNCSFDFPRLREGRSRVLRVEAASWDLTKIFERSRVFVFASVPISISLLLAVQVSGRSSDMNPHSTDWFSKAHYGLFTHFLPGPDPTESGRLMKDFDAEALADQVKASGAGYLVFTLLQNSGWINSPNAVYKQDHNREKNPVKVGELVLEWQKA